MHIDNFRLSQWSGSIHFPPYEYTFPADVLHSWRFLVLELDGRTIRNQHDLLGSIYMGLACPYFGPGRQDDLTPGYDGLDDVLGDLDWLNIEGLAVCLWNSKDLWSRLYWECGHLITSWLFVKEQRQPNLPMHLLFAHEQRRTSPGVAGERLEPFRTVEAVRWLPPGAIQES